MDNLNTNETPRLFKQFTWAYVIVGLLAIFGGLYSVNYRIKGIAPYLFSLDTTAENTNGSDQRLEEIAQLQLQDTDADGLNDFDEVYVYKTSQYIADSDSDGINDKEEVQKGSDPNCATGQDCVTTRPVAVTDTAETAGASEELDFLGKDLTPEELRAELAKMGIEQSLLDQASDEDLQAVYESVSRDYVAAQQATNQNTNTESNPATDVQINTNETDPYAEILPDTSELPADSIFQYDSIEELRNLTPAEMRSLLEQGGMSKEDLDSIDDATLQELFNQTLEAEFSQLENQ